ncbi:hypothetical protein CP978_33380 [Streptomyces nodosus]|uniref:Uncharacterized protein n=1 Tax=Streptomyces nodosus TaxID=40318 RepID=A0A5P2WG21_9ACTN|nr:hypothetical protein CP978_33380 [Streptomyces nodosus]
MLAMSGAGAAWARSAECRSSAAKVIPPPTRATAVATTARRWLFFQRARWRRRAARPSGAPLKPSDCGGCGDSSVPPSKAASSGRRPSCSRSGTERSHATTAAFTVVVAAAGTMRLSTVTGAMSGA